MAIVFAMYTGFVLLIPFPKNAVFFLSYIFTILAMAFQLLVWKLGWIESQSAQSKFYGIPILRVGILYLGLQLALGLFFMIISKWIPEWIPTLLYLLLLGAAGAGCIVTELVKEQIDKTEKKQTEKTLLIKQMRVEADYLYQMFSTTGLEKELKNLCEVLRYSDPVSAEELLEKEKMLHVQLGDLKTFLMEKDKEQAQKCLELFLCNLKERNELCKLYKH